MEEFGIEDPRIVQIDETYWITYVAVSRHGVATALASTHDFVEFERHGIVFYPENKDDQWFGSFNVALLVGCRDRFPTSLPPAKLVESLHLLGRFPIRRCRGPEVHAAPNGADSASAQ